MGLPGVARLLLWARTHAELAGGRQDHGPRGSAAAETARACSWTLPGRPGPRRSWSIQCRVYPLTAAPAAGANAGGQITPYTSTEGEAGRLPYSCSSGQASLSAARSRSTVVIPAGRVRSSLPSHSHGSEV